MAPAASRLTKEKRRTAELPSSTKRSSLRSPSLRHCEYKGVLVITPEKKNAIEKVNRFSSTKRREDLTHPRVATFVPHSRSACLSPSLYLRFLRIRSPSEVLIRLFSRFYSISELRLPPHRSITGARDLSRSLSLSLFISARRHVTRSFSVSPSISRSQGHALTIRSQRLGNALAR